MVADTLPSHIQAARYFEFEEVGEITEQEIDYAKKRLDCIVDLQNWDVPLKPDNDEVREVVRSQFNKWFRRVHLYSALPIMTRMVDDAIYVDQYDD